MKLIDRNVYFLFFYSFILLLFQGCMNSSENGQASGFMGSSIVLIVIVLLVVIIPIIRVKNKGKDYTENYKRFLTKNGKNLTPEDANLIKILVKNQYNNTLRWSIIPIIMILFIRNIPPSSIQYVVILLFLILIFNWFFAFSKFLRLCPYCKNKINLDSEKCPKCTKYIGDSWIAKPILEQLHKG